MLDDAKRDIPGEPGSLPWLVNIMQALLAPDGCPWDRQQTLQTLRRYLVEETYEVLDAIDEGDPEHHCEELGDLMFQVVFQAALAGLPMERIISGIGHKLLRRHPHVFGDAEVDGPAQVRANWEQIKRQERGADRGALAGVPRSMPPLARAQQLTDKAAGVGFDWPEARGARRKVSEELAELDQAVEQADPAAQAHELGDVLLAVVNWGRKLGLDCDGALRQANARFEGRFAAVEQALARQGETMQHSTLEQLDRLWDAAKKAERER